MPRDCRFAKRYVCLLLALAALPPAAQAKKMYKFQDSQGRWNFSDVKPDESQARSLEVRQVAVEPARAVVLEERDENGVRRVLASNRLAGPVEVEVTLRQAVNIATDPPLPHRFVLAANSKNQPIIEMRQQNAQQAGSISYVYSHAPGDPAAVPQENYPYLPPIASGSRFTVTQGFFGAYSHQGVDNRYAVDIAMPEGTPVHAIRGGVVFAVENDFYESGIKEKLQSRANYVRVLHDDGTMAVYAHLALESALVSPGQKVAAGQRIGISGSTGYATGPHLHLVIQRNAGMTLEAVPFRFLSPDGALREPKEGDVLQGSAISRP